MDNDYAAETITSSLNDSFLRVNDICKMDDDRMKIRALLEEVGTLQGHMVFVREILVPAEKKSFWKFWK